MRQASNFPDNQLDYTDNDYPLVVVVPSLYGRQRELSVRFLQHFQGKVYFVLRNRYVATQVFAIVNAATKLPPKQKLRFGIFIEGWDGLPYFDRGQLVTTWLIVSLLPLKCDCWVWNKKNWSRQSRLGFAKWRTKQIFQLLLQPIVQSKRQLALLRHPNGIKSKQELRKEAYDVGELQGKSDISLRFQAIHTGSHDPIIKLQLNNSVVIHTPMGDDFIACPPSNEDRSSNKNPLKIVAMPTSEIGQITADLKKIELESDTNNTTHVFLANGFQNYYHWLVEFLPLLFLVDRSSRETPIDLLVTCSKNYHIETLDLLFAAGRINVTKLFPGMYAECRNITTYSYMSPSNTPRKYLLDQTRVCLLHQAGDLQKSESRSTRLFLCRSGHKNERSISNFDELKAELETFGFTFIHCDNMPVKDQIILFQKAEIVVSPHQGALANLIFCTRNTSVIEIFANEDVRPHYFYLARLLGLRYFPLYQTSVVLNDDSYAISVESQVLINTILEALNPEIY